MDQDVGGVKVAVAPPARRASRPAGAGPARSDRTGYATIEHAGKPHKGKITDAEKQLVREHLDEINERLAAQGLRTISLADPAPAMAARLRVKPGADGIGVTIGDFATTRVGGTFTLAYLVHTRSRT